MANPHSADQIFISKLTEIILANIQDENFGVNELVRESGLSLYKLNRKLHSINKKTINRFIREVRLQKAREMLHDGEYTASEVVYRTGFSSPAYFTKRFHEYYGYPPGKAKNGDTSEKELNTQTAPVNGYVPGRDVRRTLIRSYPGILFLGLILAAIVYVTYNLFNKPGPEGRLISRNGRISIAVMAFPNLTNDTIWDIWQPAIQTNLITSLSNSGDLKVRQIETINGLLKGKGITDYASINPRRQAQSHGSSTQMFLFLAALIRQVV